MPYKFMDARLFVSIVYPHIHCIFSAKAAFEYHAFQTLIQSYDVCLSYANLQRLLNAPLVKRITLSRNLKPPGTIPYSLTLPSCFSNLVFVLSPAGKKITSLIKTKM